MDKALEVSAVTSYGIYETDMKIIIAVFLRVNVVLQCDVLHHAAQA